MLKFKLTTKSVAVGALFVTLSVATASIALDVASVEKARQYYFHSIGKPSKALKDELKKSNPDLAAVRGDVAQLTAAAPHLMAQFPNGSGPQNGLKTEVLAEVWNNPTKFKQNNDAFQTSVKALDQAAQSGRIDAVRTAVDGMGQTCKSCHETFRKEDH